MQRLEVSGAVRPIYGSLDVKRLIYVSKFVGLEECNTRLQAHTHIWPIPRIFKCAN